MKPAKVPLVMIMWIGISLAVAGAIASETAEEAKPAEAKPVEAKSAEDSKAEADTPKEFKPPPGFVTKKRGQYVLYCKRDTTVGTRFKTETCYDEDQIRDYMLALEENNRDIDRIRATCSNVCVCGGDC